MQLFHALYTIRSFRCSSQLLYSRYFRRTIEVTASVVICLNIIHWLVKLTSIDISVNYKLFFFAFTWALATFEANKMSIHVFIEIVNLFLPHLLERTHLKGQQEGSRYYDPYEAENVSFHQEIFEVTSVLRRVVYPI